MSESNRKTLESYEGHVQEYIDGTPQEVTGDVKLWIERTLVGLEHDAKILEIGSAFGRDANYIETLGYTVMRTDATEKFVELLKEQGYEAGVFNAITDDFPEENDLVFADAVLLHFTEEETLEVCKKVLGSLVHGGRFSFSLKSGTGTEWSDSKLGAPRFFRYWEQSGISNLLREVGFTKVDIENGESGRQGYPSWLHIVAYK
jgi:SAM-dependent methyltransferase